MDNGLVYCDDFPETPLSRPHEKSNPLHWIWLSLVLGVANRFADRLLTQFGGSASEIFAAPPEKIEQLSYLGEKAKAGLLAKDLSEAMSIMTWCERSGVRLLPCDDSFYPDRLRRIEDRPLILYYRGRVPDINRSVCVAMVGTRNISDYGTNYAYTIAHDCARCGVVVVSGLALGVDAVCHRAALDAGG